MAPTASRTTTKRTSPARKHPAAATQRTSTSGTKVIRRRGATPHHWWLLPPVAVAVVALLVASFYPVARVQYRETRERALLQDELANIRARNDRLLAEVERLKTPDGVEDYARLQLGLVRKGEHQVVVVEGTESTHTLAAQGAPKIDSQEAANPQIGPWTAFLDAVFGVQ